MNVWSAISQLPAVMRVWRSGLFDGAAYISENPSITNPRFTRTYHWVKHGYLAGYNPGGHVLQQWLLPKVTTGDLPPALAKKTKFHHDNNNLETFCRDSGLVFAEYEALSHYLAMDFEAASAKMEESGPLFALRLLHKSLRAVPNFPGFRDHVNALKTRTENGKSFAHSEDLIRYRDLAFTAGHPWAEIARINQRIKARLDRRKATLSPLAAGGLLPLRLEDRAPKARQPGDETYVQFQHVSARNACRESGFTALIKQGDSWQEVPATERSVTLLLPDMGLWFQTASAPKTIRAGLDYILSRWGETVSFIPLPPSQGRNLTHADWPGARLISYHTFAGPRDDILHWKEGSLRGHLFFDRQGYSGGSSIAADGFGLLNGQSGENWPDFVANHLGQTTTKYEQIQDDSRLPDKGYIFVPLQVPFDSASIWHDLSPLTALEIVCEFAAKSGHSVVTKRHPHDRSEHTQKGLSKIALKYKNLHVTQNRIDSIIEQAAVVVTANSAVGFEALLAGKAVITTGRSDYRPGTIYCQNTEALKRGLNQILKTETPRPSEGFLLYFFTHHDVNLTSISAKSTAAEAFFDAI